MQRDLLLLGANAPEMQLLRARLARMGYRVVPAKTPDQAQGFVRAAGARIGAVIVPSDLPAVSLRVALEGLRRLVPGPEQQMVFLGAGRDPGEPERARMREAGVSIPIFDPIDSHTLRFQVNRALGRPRSVRLRRGTLRAPADWRVLVRSGGREKEGRIYALSPSGCFVALAQPWMLRSQVLLRIARPDAPPVAATGRVAMTNVPGNVMRPNLPFGMGVRFDHLSEADSVALLVWAEERQRALAI